jgi:glycerol-3-phosphate dehydrogenase subunit C
MADQDQDGARPEGAKEGSTEAPTRHALAWQDPDFYDDAKIDAELRRVFDICHGCRRCFNLCDSFPRLFDLIDESETGELDSVDSKDFKPVEEACTLCDMCFMTKCPYVPPHPFDLDFPHLMLRARARDFAGHGVDIVKKELAKTDRNGRLAAPVAPLANWGAAKDNALTRPVLAAAGIDRDASLPKYHRRTFVMQAKAEAPEVNRAAPAFGRKAVLYATCFVNYNKPATGVAARGVLAQNGVETAVCYPACCGMPFFEYGNIEQTAKQARKVSKELLRYIDDGYAVIALTASCGLMLKFEWPLILPDDADIKRLAENTYDIDQYMVDIARKEGLADGLQPLDGGVTVHLPCHARAQNMGPKSAEMLRLIPETKVDVVERCSGHGGTFGVLKGTHEVAVKVGRPAARAAQRQGNAHLASSCPLAGAHLLQVMADSAEGDAAGPTRRPFHPIELMAQAYGIDFLGAE